MDYVDFLGRSGDPDAALAEVPPDWDYVLDDERSRQPAQLEFGGVRAFYQASHRHFRARIRHGTAGSEPPAYVPNRRLRLELPGELRGRTSTSATEEGLDRIAAAARNVVRAIDLPLLEQLAFVEVCSLFVSPHTGFGCAVLAVGTPWLALSGGPWHEWFFNDVPFWSVIPDTERYPCFTQLSEEQPAPVDDDGPRTPSMTRARIEQDLPELLEGARLLADGRLEYDEALRRYFRGLVEAYGGDRSRVFPFDGIHHAYI